MSPTGRSPSSDAECTPHGRYLGGTSPPHTGNFPFRRQPFARPRSGAGPHPQGHRTDIGRGEAIGLVGPSGSGKSTLLMVMAGLERPMRARSRSPGEDIGRLDEDALARFRGRKIGIVFQSFHLIPTMTALENVAVPLELAGDARRLRRARRPSSPRSGSASGSAIIRPSFRAASSSASRSPARWRRAPRSSSPTSRPEISTRRPAARSST